MATDTEIDGGLGQLADRSSPDDFFAPRLIRRTSRVQPEQDLPGTIEEFQRRFLPNYRLLLPAPPRGQNHHTEEEILAGQALLDLWKSQLVSQAPQPGGNPPIVPPPTVFYAAGRPLIPDRRNFEMSLASATPGNRTIKGRTATTTCGVWQPAQNWPPKAIHRPPRVMGNGEWPFSCVLCGSKYVALKKLNAHFPKCVDIYGNPYRYHWDDDSSVPWMLEGMDEYKPGDPRTWWEMMATQSSSP